MNPGDLVTEQLRLVRKLGQGGMGSVWVADHLKLETQVALKFVSSELLGHSEARARFQREAISAAKIHSPHVVRVFDHGLTNEGVPYIAMELLSGQDLGKYIDEQGPLTIAFVRVVLTQACRGLSRAHELGIVHRDLKPENIFISDEGGEPFVRLLDFGVAKQALGGELGLTASGTMMGTPYYMSPEQAMSARQVDFRSDLWSLAVVTYHALTGQRPFDGETLGALCVKLHAAQFEPATRLRTELPPSIDTWFQRALAREPTARFGSAKEMAQAFALATGASKVPQFSSLMERRAPVAVAPQVPLPPDTIAHAASEVQRTQLRRSTPLLVTVVGLVLLAALVIAGVWTRTVRAPATGPSVAVSSPLPSTTSAAPSAKPFEATTAAAALTQPSASVVASSPALAASASPLRATAEVAVSIPVVRSGSKPKSARHQEATPSRAQDGAAAPVAVPAPPVDRSVKKDRGF